MKLRKQKVDGASLTINGAKIPFSLFKTDYAGQNFVPLQEPWGYAEFHLKNTLTVSRAKVAVAYLEQARSFYQTARNANRDAAPLLWYYCFLNLAKTYLAQTEPVNSLARAVHGIGDLADNANGYMTLNRQRITASGAPRNPNRFEIFPQLCAKLGRPLPPRENKIPIRTILRQVLGIHRAYMKAFKEESHFLKLREPEFLEFRAPPANGALWLRLYLRREDFSKKTVTFAELKKKLRPELTAVTPEAHGESIACHCFESEHHPFARYASDALLPLRAQLRRKIRTLILPRGYLYYVMHERERVLPQAAAIYAVMFYLGSIVRYRPYDFDKLIEKKFRWVIDEFIQIAPKQFVILMINEITQSEISYFEN